MFAPLPGVRLFHLVPCALQPIVIYRVETDADVCSSAPISAPTPRMLLTNPTAAFALLGSKPINDFTEHLLCQYRDEEDRQECKELVEGACIPVYLQCMSLQNEVWMCSETRYRIPNGMEKPSCLGEAQDLIDCRRVGACGQTSSFPRR